MPVKLGLKKAARFTMALALLVILSLLMAVIALYVNRYILLSLYTLVFISLPLIAWLLYLPRGADTMHYARASRGLRS